MKTRDVAVVGAGPASTAAATKRWPKRALDVVVLDRATFPRTRSARDGLAALASVFWSNSRVDRAPSPTGNGSMTAWFFPPTGHCVRFPLPRGVGTMPPVVPGWIWTPDSSTGRRSGARR